MTQKNSIYLRLVIPLGVTLLVAMLAAWAIAAYLLTRVMEQRLDEQLGNATSILAQGTFPLTPDLIARLDSLIRARIALLDSSGRIGLSTAQGQADPALASLVNRLHEFSQAPVVFLTEEASGISYRIAVRPLAEARDQRFRFVAAAAPLSAIREASGKAALLLGAAMLFATLLLAWFGSYFTRTITRPVGDLAQMAGRIAEGEREIESDITEGNEIGVLAKALNDMTVRLGRYETELARQSRLSGLGDLAARMAHEVRNPLTAIKMQLQLLEERAGDDDSRLVHGLLDEIRRLEMIVESTLALGGPMKLNCQDLKPDRIIDEVVELLRPSLEHRGIDVTIETKQSKLVNADPHRLKQVLLNLINNAADELGDGGKIRIGTELADDGDMQIITVEDSGPGLPDEADGTQTSKPFGLGLGLTICHEIIQQHGGTLEKGSSPALGGAKFTLRLPALIIGTS